MGLAVHGPAHDACHHTLHIHLRYQSSDVAIQQWVDVEPCGLSLYNNHHRKMLKSIKAKTAAIKVCTLK